MPRELPFVCNAESHGTMVTNMAAKSTATSTMGWYVNLFSSRTSFFVKQRERAIAHRKTSSRTGAGVWKKIESTTAIKKMRLIFPWIDSCMRTPVSLLISSFVSFL